MAKQSPNSTPKPREQFDEEFDLSRLDPRLQRHGDRKVLSSEYPHAVIHVVTIVTRGGS